MKKILSLLLVILGVFMTTSCSKTSISTASKTTISDTSTTSSVKDTTTKTKKTTYFSGVEFLSEPVVNETFIMSLTETKEGTIKENLNPYKTTSISIDAYFTDEKNNEYYRPAYWTQDYKISLNTLNTSDTYVFKDELKGTDTANKKGIEHFNVSFKPLSAGKYTYKIEINVKGKFIETLEGEFEVSSSNKEYKGKIVIDSSNNRYFMYENTGETYIPVGMNVSWYTSVSRKSYDYDEWLGRMKDNGGNWTRIWMASWGFALHIGGGSKVDDFTGRLNQAARLERVLSNAEKDGIYLYLTMNNHGQFSSSVNPEWDDNPYNKIVDKAYNFWVSEKCKNTYKDEIRYIVARYGTYDSLMAYELFNEVDWTDAASLYDQKIKEWHDEMAKYIKEIDCYHRMVTTSYKYTIGAAYSLDSIDIANIHTYDFSRSEPISGVKNLIDISYRNYKKPVLLSEWGVNASTGYDTYKVDPEGITLYQSLWAAVMEGAAGTPMTWWWDTYIHKYNLYHLYKGIGTFVNYMDLSGDITYLNDLSLKERSEDLSFIGVKSNKGIYGYLYDNKYSRTNTGINSFTFNLKIEANNGSYDLILMNPRTGEIITEETINVTGGIINYSIPKFDSDIAIIINKK